MQQYSTTYTLGFSAAVCVVCSLLVSASAVLLESRQKENAVLDRQKNVLRTAGLVQPQQAVSREEVADIFKRCIRPVDRLAPPEGRRRVSPVRKAAA